MLLTSGFITDDLSFKNLTNVVNDYFMRVIITTVNGFFLTASSKYLTRQIVY